MKKLVSIMIPCYNEQEALPRMWQELCKVMDAATQYSYEAFFINDGSSDNTLRILKELHETDGRVSYVNLSRNFGKENAMLAGFDLAKGDCLVIMDADLQDPPQLMVEMLEYWEQGYQDVYAKRRDRGEESWLRKKLSLLFYKILDSATRFEVLKNVGDFRLLDRKCINALQSLRENERYTKGMFCWIGYKKKEIVFDRGNRVAGESKWNFCKLLNLAIEGISSFTTFPLRVATISGFIIAICAFLFLLYYVIKTITVGDPVQGFTTLVALMLFLGGVQLIAIGVLGEYIGRVFNETKGRPVYLIEDYKVATEVIERYSNTSGKV